MSNMTDETYNGYANRETWAFNLHWQNDQGLYSETLEAAANPLPEWSDSSIGEYVVNYWRDQIDSYEEEVGAPLPAVLRMFRDEVGSWWRVDYAEVGAAVRESLDAESE